MLKRMGLAECTEGIDAQLVQGYAIIKDGRAACVKYPTEGFDEDIAGRSFHHGRFVQNLRHRAASNSNVCMRQGIATRLITQDGGDYDELEDTPVAGVSYKADGEMHTAFAHLTVACDGMYSMLRKRLHERADSVRCVHTMSPLQCSPLAVHSPHGPRPFIRALHPGHCS